MMSEHDEENKNKKINKSEPTNYELKYYIKTGVTLKEYKMHQHVYRLGIVNTPKILAYGKETQVMVLEKINQMCLSDYYGDKGKNIPLDLFDKIKEVIKKLWDNNIVYPDITGYNFIEYENKLWIIDFEHSNFKPLVKKEFVEFVNKFANDKQFRKWNPEFK